MKRKLAIALACAAALAAAALLFLRPGRKGLTLYCGAGIRPAAAALVEAFERETGTRVNVTYGGSGLLLGQLSAARKGDLFMPGAKLYVRLAVEKGLADPATERVVAYFVPVIFVRKGNPEKVRSVHDFTRAGLKLGLGDERSCAVGRKTLEILGKHGLGFADVEENVVFRSGTVTELAVAVQLGTVDAVIIWDAVARNFAGSGAAVPIPLERNAISTIPVVRLVFSRSPSESDRFIGFVTSHEGRRILLGRGYTVTLGEGPTASAGTRPPACAVAGTADRPTAGRGRGREAVP